MRTGERGRRRKEERGRGRRGGKEGGEGERKERREGGNTNEIEGFFGSGDFLFAVEENVPGSVCNEFGDVSPV